MVVYKLSYRHSQLSSCIWMSRLYGDVGSSDGDKDCQALLPVFAAEDDDLAGSSCKGNCNIIYIEAGRP